MAHHPTPTDRSDEAAYEIRISGMLGSRWAGWFDGLTVRDGGDGTTVITGLVADQAALFGLLQRVHGLGLPLISVARIDPGTNPRS
ncbi:MAG TPA: hypothetical protein VFV72_14140 [Candidatus Limnocylindrales bacterium]|nr:hypothetical protein [Candidatus Limnocylindrales bacterium]